MSAAKEHTTAHHRAQQYSQKHLDCHYLINPLNAEPVFVVFRYKHQCMSIITIALIYTWKVKTTRYFEKSFPDLIKSLKLVLCLIKD